MSKAQKPKTEAEVKAIFDPLLEKRTIEVGMSAEAITFDSLLDAVAEVLKDGKIDAADKPIVVKLAEEAFESYVRPFDIPGIPNLLENYVDDILKGLIKPAVEQLFGRFVGVS